MQSMDMRRLLTTLALMLVVAISVLLFLMSGKNGTLVRNSLIAGSMPESGFLWRPGAEPDSYKLEDHSPPGWLEQEFSFLAGIDQGQAKVEAAIKALHNQPHRGGAIRSDLHTTWKLIDTQGRGYCADFSKLFTALMLEAEVPVREWALGHENFGSGHTFNEVFINGQWVFVDSYNGMMVKDSETGRLLSVLEFRSRLEQADFDSLLVLKFTDPDSFFQTREEGLDYYARSSDFFYLMWGNNVFSYDTNPWIVQASQMGRAMERLVAMLVGQYPEIRMLETKSNNQAIEEVESLRFMLYAALIVEALLGIFLLRLCWKMFRQRKNINGV